MPKQKIGEDVLKKSSGVISTKKDSEEFEEFREERERQKKFEEIKGRKIKEEPSDEELIKEKEREMERMAEAKRKGLLKSKPVHVREHHRKPPKKEKEFEEIF